MHDASLGGISALDGSQPQAVRRRPAAPRGRQSLWSRFRHLRSRLALIVGSAGFSAIMIGIVLNATMMQKGHHPAPLFATATHAPTVQPVAAVPAASSAAPATPVVVPAPVPAPVAVEPAVPTPPAARSVAHAAPASHSAKPVDGIGRFLAGASPQAAQLARKSANSPLTPVSRKPAHPRPPAVSGAPPKPAAE